LHVAACTAAFQVLKNSADDLRVFDAGDDLHRSAAVLATLNLDAEDAFESLCPAHRHVPGHRPALTLCLRATAAALARHDLGSESMMRGKSPW
jgi:hypothetical protein